MAGLRILINSLFVTGVLDEKAKFEADILLAFLGGK